MCYVHASVLVYVFPTGIERLLANAKKPNVDAIQQETRHKLLEICAEKLRHQCQKEKMTDL